VWARLKAGTKGKCGSAFNHTLGKQTGFWSANHEMGKDLRQQSALACKKERRYGVRGQNKKMGKRGYNLQKF